MASDAPVRSVSRAAETARPARNSGARLRVAPIPPPPISVVERLKTENFPCAHRGCKRDGVIPSLVPALGTTLAALFCETCVVELAPRGLRALPNSRVGR